MLARVEQLEKRVDSVDVRLSDADARYLEMSKTLAAIQAGSVHHTGQLDRLHDDVTAVRKSVANGNAAEQQNIHAMEHDAAEQRAECHRRFSQIERDMRDRDAELAKQVLQGEATVSRSVLVGVTAWMGTAIIAVSMVAGERIIGWGVALWQTIAGRG
jgi:hypothetical protein